MTEEQKANRRRLQKEYYSRNKEELKAKSTAQSRRWRQANRERVNANNKRWREANKDAVRNNELLRDYGLTLEDRDRMFAEQTGCCAICKAQLKTGTGGFAIDHCHSSGKIRSLLCKTCNTGLGNFLDRPDLLIAAAKYLETHST